MEPARADIFFGQADRREVTFPVRRQETVHKQARPAVLDIVALLSQAADPLVRWADTIDFLTNVLRVFPGKNFIGALGVGAARDLDRDFPLVARLRDSRAGNFR